MSKKNIQNQAFSLIELLVVIGVILVLMGLVLPMAGKAMNKADIAATKATLEKIEMAVRNYYSSFGDYPPDLSYRYLGQKLFSPDFGAVVPVLEYEENQLFNPTAATNNWVYADAWRRSFNYYFVGIDNSFNSAFDNLTKTGSYLEANSQLDFIGDMKTATIGDEKLNKGFVIWSLGPDGVSTSGTEDDIGNWGFTRSKSL